MKPRYRLIRRGVLGGLFYCVDSQTGKRTSLQTSDEDSAQQIIQAKNQAERQPSLNLHIAKAYLAGTDPKVTTRTWRDAFQSITDTKQGANKDRWGRAAKDKAFDLIHDRVPDGAGDGMVPFRGELAAIVRGPAIVELAYPFQVERLPTDSENYWRDLKFPRVQMEFALPMK